MTYCGNNRLWQNQQRYRFGVRRQYVLPLGLVLSVLGGSVLGCSSDTTGPAALSPVQAYWALQINYHAINMAVVAPDDTVRLIATPLNVAGAPLTGLGSATFQASDSTVSVDSTGLVTAHFASQGQPTPVIVSLYAQGVTLADTVLVQVTDTIPQHMLATFSLQPAPGDSAKRALSLIHFMWAVAATDVAQNIVCDSTACPLQIYYTSSNPQIASIDMTGRVTTNDTGHVVFAASTWTYGKFFQDSIKFTIGYRTRLDVFIDDEPSAVMVFAAPQSVILGVGATVTFVCIPPAVGYSCVVPIDVAFDHPEQVDTATDDELDAPPTGTGDIPAFGADSIDVTNDVRARRFPVAGTYQYHSSVIPSETDTLIIKKQQ